MAIVSGNSMLRDVSGMVGGTFVFKRFKDKTVVSARPTPRRRNSVLQERNCDRFKAAAHYARLALRDEGKRAYYTKMAVKLGKRCAYNAAVADYMLAVDVSVVGVLVKSTNAGGSGKADREGSRVVVAVDKRGFKVEGVSVCAIAVDGTEVGGGSAKRINATEWVYHYSGNGQPVVVVVRVQEPFGRVFESRIGLNG